MKKINLGFLLTFIGINLFAQHNYDDQSIIYSNNGNVGIGTGNPSSLLEIADLNATNGESISFNFALKGAKSGIKSTLKHPSYNISDLSFFTDPTGGPAVERMRITENGYIGIGTTTPTSLLEIADLNATNGESISFSFALKGAKSGIKSTLKHPSYNISDLSFFTDPTGGPAVERMRITENGYIGIGTTTPQQLLTVSETDRPVLRLDRSGTGKFDWEIYSQSGGSLFFRGGSDGFGDSLNDFLTIQSNGSVGIGTTTPDSELTVKGTIHTNEVKVDLQGAVAPDYVFESDYELRTLEETETYIKENCHLPEIPSAYEMEKDGVNLKEMNLKLLKKVEELTLYMIEMNKAIKGLKEDNQALNSEVFMLRKGK